MKDHPIPQDIVGYRFHIVGNMTIKQFAEIAAGAGVSFLLWNTNLHPYIKWPLIGASFAFGAALAFVPFEERPLDHWFSTFIKVLYKPTKFFWKKSAKIPEPFLYEAMKKEKNEFDDFDLSPARRERIKEYLQSVDRLDVQDDFETRRQLQISQIMATFDSVTAAQVNVTSKKRKPQLKVRVRSLSSGNTPNFNANSVVEEEIEDDYELEQNRKTLELRTPLAVGQVAQEITIPEQEMIKVDDQGLSDEETIVVDNQQTNQDRAYIEAAVPDIQQQAVGAQNATYNQDLPFPTKPTEPNRIVGMVLTPNNELVNDAIIEVKAESGNTVRAVKTNALGQFFITTPLQNGTYTIEVDREGMGFSPLSIILKGDAVDPIEIRSVT